MAHIPLSSSRFLFRMLSQNSFVGLNSNMISSKGFARSGFCTSYFNVREVVKQLLLIIELLTKEEVCSDCVRKRLLLAETLAEEAMTSGRVTKWSEIAFDLSRRIRRWQIAFIDGRSVELLSHSIQKRVDELNLLVVDSRL